MTMSRDFRTLLVGQTLSWVGNGFQTVALSVAVILGGGSPTDLGLVLMCSILGRIGGVLFGGVWADRLQPRRVMVGSDLVRVVATGGMALMFHTAVHPLALLCGLVAINSVAAAFFDPAMQSLKPLLLPPDQRQRANATMTVLRSSATIVGPALGGLVVAAFGAGLGFTVNSASYLASAVSVLLVSVRADRVRARTSMLHELRAGWREVASRDWLCSGVFAATLYHVANGAVLVLAPVVAIRSMGGAHAVGWISAAEGFGGVVGAGIALRHLPARALLAGWLALPLMTLWVLAFVWPSTLASAIVGAALGYAGLMYFDVGWETSIQNNVPHAVMARVASWDMLTSFVAMPVGNALAGPLADAFGINAVLVVCAAVLLVASLSPLAFRGTRELTITAPEPVPA